LKPVRVIVTDTVRLEIVLFELVTIDDVSSASDAGYVQESRTDPLDGRVTDVSM
jgi:hypothetical protein